MSPGTEAGHFSEVPALANRREQRLRSEMLKELDLAPPNTAGKQAEGKPLLAVYKEESA